MTVDDHYIDKSQITSYQKEQIALLRTRAKDILATYPEYDTDFSLLRWLLGWDYDIDTILPKLKKAVSTIVNLGYHKIQATTPEEINDFVRSMSVGASYFPGGVMSQDDEGNMVYMQAIALVHPKSLVKAGSVSELYKLSIAESELAFNIIRKTEERKGKKLGVKIVMDLDGFNMDLLNTATLKIYLNLLAELQDIFPDFARQIYIINPPMMMSTVYELIKPVLSKQTREKVVFLGSDWKERISKDIGPHNIFSKWGGTKRADNETGGIRMGGKVPEKLWYNAEEHPLDGEKSLFTKVSVSARSKTEVKIEVKKGQKLQWIWKVSSGDLDFWIEFRGREVYPKLRLSTDFVPEIGHMTCDSEGEYVLFFDNSHGKVFGKDVKYRVVLE